MREVTICVDTGVVHPFGLLVGDPKAWPPPPVLLFMAFDVASALAEGGVRWQCGHARQMQVTRDGVATVTGLDGRQYVYELHPARIGNERPYDPSLYVGVWPD